MKRTWFRCHICDIECATSVIAPGYENKPAKICIPCSKSFCKACDSLYGEPLKAPSYGWYALCPECGYTGYLDDITARNVIELNRQEKEPSSEA